MSNLKPITLYNHASGPNPWKVAIILEELGLPYESEFIDFSVIKQEPFVSVNPNGRVPAIKDPNTDIVLWESGAIIDYLIDTYDKEGMLHYTEFPQKYYEKSWEHFQMSGQGPYFGQMAWFSFFHSEKGLTSVTDRYANEIKRVLGVIEAQLTKNNTEYLVGDKVSYADLMFVMWNSLPPFLVKDLEWEKNYPKCYAWDQKLRGRESVKRALAKQDEQKKKEGK